MAGDQQDPESQATAGGCRAWQWCCHSPSFQLRGLSTDHRERMLFRERSPLPHRQVALRPRLGGGWGSPQQPGAQAQTAVPRHVSGPQEGLVRQGLGTARAGTLGMGAPVPALLAPPSWFPGPVKTQKAVLL